MFYLKIRVKPTRLFVNYLISYVGILFIPLIIIGAMVYSNFVNILTEEIITNNLNNLSKVQYVIDGNLTQIEKISNQINLVPKLKSYEMHYHWIKADTIRNTLCHYVTTNKDIDNIFIYYHGDEYLFSSTSSYTFPMFKAIYNYTDWSVEDMYEDIVELKQTQLRPSENVIYNKDHLKKYITLLYPLNKNTSIEGTIIFMIPEESFQSVLKDTINTYRGNSFILDGNNNIVTCLKDSPYLRSNDFTSYLKEVTANHYTETVTLDNEKYFLTYVKSPQTDFKYVSMVPIDKVMGKVKHTKYRIFYSLIIILAVGIIVIYYTMHINYTPIKQLKNYAVNLIKPEKQGMNAIEILRSTMDTLTSENNQLSSTIKDNTSAAKDYLLFCLFKGQIDSNEDFNKKGERINLSLTKSCYRAILFKLNGLNTKEKKIYIIEQLHSLLNNPFEAFGRELIDENNVIFLLASDDSDIETIHRKLLSIQDFFKEHDLIITIGVGNSYTELNQMPNSYLEACTAIDYRFVKGNDQIIYYNEIVIDSSKFVKPPNDLNKLSVAIKQGNTEQVDQILVNILSYIKDNNPPLFIVKRLCYELINSVTKTMNDINKEYAVPFKRLPHVFSLSEFETVDHLTKIIKRVCINVCSYINDNQEMFTSELANQVVNYVKENYSSCDFSVKSIAQKFNMSVPYLSQFFKNHTNLTIQDYTTSLKIDKAKELLISTKMTINQIAGEVGYYNVTSFIRRFKQLIGTTPGRYRKDYKN